MTKTNTVEIIMAKIKMIKIIMEIFLMAKLEMVKLTMNK
jgi:hypothetical protein